MIRCTYLLFFLFVLSFCTSASSVDKCDLDHLKGEWYGEFNFYSGTTFLMYMNVTEVKKCTVKGVFHWPDYFNSKTIFEGSLEGDSLQIVETRITQGKIMDIDGASYTLMPALSDTLKGFASAYGEEVASFTLYRAATMSPERLAATRSQIATLEEKYGFTQIGEAADVEAKELVEIYRDKANDQTIKTTLELYGAANVSQINLPMYAIIAPQNKYYMEMSFQEVKFKGASNGKISWEYDPVNEKLSVDEREENSDDGMDQFNNRFLEAVDENNVELSVQNALVNDTPAYRVRVAYKDGDLQAYYLSKSDYHIIRQEHSTQIDEYTNYISTGGFWFPTKVKQMQAAGKVTQFLFDEIETDVDVDQSVFEVPESLKHLLEPTEKVTVSDLASEAYDAGNYERAVELYTKAIDNEPYNSWYYYMRGSSKYELGDNYGAIGDLERAISLKAGNASYYNQRGLVKYRLSDYTNAAMDFQRAIQLDSTMDIGYENLAFSLYNLEDKDSALYYLNKAVALDSTMGEYYYNRASIHSELDNYEASLSDYQKSLELEYGDSAVTQNRIGVVYYKLEKFEKAVTCFKKALETYPEEYQYLKNLGDTYMQLENHKEAIHYLEAGYKLKTDDDLLNGLALAYNQNGDPDASLVYLNKAIEINPKNASYYDNRADVHVALMKYQEAITDFTTSLQLYPDDPEIYYRRGMVRKLQNNRFDACSDFKKAVELGHELAEETMEGYCLTTSDDDEE